ncbi:MAG: multidrug efflux pump subunit AcrA (membrane-fusion protein) [Psychromonas sp.]|jgi:multidrug efflux pump subunit AcrA (membrane-fusion protein)|uniref:efflux RND transporter periplasmic adaptor subunit n=1 Tax=Psychromonas sp. TaxID=1884585 RepID=UPI0039E6E447
MRADKKRFAIPGIVLGLLILMAAVALKPSPDLQANYDRARLVEVMSLLKQPAAPLIKGFGRVAPKHTWLGIAEVNGKIIYRHPELETGRLLTKGTMVLEVDPLQYKLKLAQAEANLNSAKAQLTRLAQQQQNLNISLNLEQQKLALVKLEYQRKLGLKNKKLISNSDLENEKRGLLTQRVLVQNLSSSLSLMPDDKKVTEAQININQALLDDAQRQLENTRFILPFDAQIGAVNIEVAQAVTTGSVLFAAQKLGSVEIKAELSQQDANRLRQSVVSFPDNRQLPSIENLDFKTRVALQLGNKTHYWPAELTRIAETIDPLQGTIGFYVEVRQDLDALDLHNTPLLSNGMFVSVDIQGEASAHFIVPEKALHGTNIYIMDKEEKLRIKTVTVLFRNEQGVAIAGDLSDGEQLVLNDLIPAIAGMSLKSGSSNTSSTKQEATQ